MDTESSELNTYRFEAIGTEYVHTRCVTYLGYWKQTIPLSDIRTQYGELRTTPDGFVKTWAVAMCTIAVGV